MKCPYCARTLPRGSYKCRPCRRYVFTWPRLVVLSLLLIFVALAFLEIFLSLS